MKVTVNASVISLEDDPLQNSLSFDVDQDDIDLTELAKSLGDSEKIIEVTPSSHIECIQAYKVENELEKKLLQYIYQLIDAFNESFREVYLEDSSDADDPF